MQMVWRRSIQNPKNFISYAQGPDSVLGRVQKERFVLVTEEAYLRYQTAKLQSCDLQVFTKGMTQLHLAFPAHKGFPYLEAFNQRFVHLSNLCCIFFSENCQQLRDLSPHGLGPNPSVLARIQLSMAENYGGGTFLEKRTRL